MYLLKYFDRRLDAFASMIIDADTNKKAINKTKEILDSVGTQNYDDPWLEEIEGEF